MKDKPATISQTAELLRLRGLMQIISQISFTYSILNKKYPMDVLSATQADELITEYKKLLERSIGAIKTQKI